MFFTTNRQILPSLPMHELQHHHNNKWLLS
jgi:hypothetical protein